MKKIIPIFHLLKNTAITTLFPPRPLVNPQKKLESVNSLACGCYLRFLIIYTKNGALCERAVFLTEEVDEKVLKRALSYTEFGVDSSGESLKYHLRGGKN